LKHTEENVNGIKDDKEKIKENITILCCSQTRLDFFNSAEYDVFSFKSTTW
jgi:hypothetical protein